ncbi:Zinc finger protein [Schistosoma japonicum]|nr:Zinc finger protein [Schistosoma japonicum]
MAFPVHFAYEKSNVHDDFSLHNLIQIGSGAIWSRNTPQHIVHNCAPVFYYPQCMCQEFIFYQIFWNWLKNITPHNNRWIVNAKRKAHLASIISVGLIAAHDIVSILEMGNSCLLFVNLPLYLGSKFDFTPSVLSFPGPFCTTGISLTLPNGNCSSFFIANGIQLGRYDHLEPKVHKNILSPSDKFFEFVSFK